MNSITPPSTKRNATRQKPPPTSNGAKQHLVTGDRRVDVGDAVGDMRIVAQRPGDGAVGLEAQVLDVEWVGARARDPHAGGVDEHLAVVPFVRDHADVVEARALDPIHLSSASQGLRGSNPPVGDDVKPRMRGSLHALRRERSVAITGGGGGIGTALVRRFAAEGASVHCIDIDAGRAKAAASGGGLRSRGRRGRRHRRRRCRAGPGGGRVDVLVNNALSGDQRQPRHDRRGSWRRDMDGTLTSAFLCTRAVLPGMIERGGGAIVNVASVNGLGDYGNEPYSAAKAGLLSLTGSVAARYGRYGVRANAVAPGTIRTAVWDERVAREPDLLARLTKWFPLGRIGTPDDVASCVLFLASDEAGFVTGATLTVDGGLTTGQLRMAEELLVESRDSEI